MIHRPSRRDALKTAAKLAVAGSLGADYTAVARAKKPAGLGLDAFAQIDSVLRLATNAEEVSGVVALAATDNGIVYEGVFGRRRLDAAPGMTRDTVFRVASMVKLITSVAALQLVEQDKLSLDAPVPDIDPAIGSPQVLDGFDAQGMPQLRPAKQPISLRHLLTHTSGFSYRLWDAKAARYASGIDRLPAAERARAPHTPLMFDPGERWQYGPSIDWVGRIVESISGEPIDAYFRKHILDPLGMKDTGFVLSTEQSAREASLHKRGPNGSLAAQSIERQQPGRKSFSGVAGSTLPHRIICGSSACCWAAARSTACPYFVRRPSRSWGRTRSARSKSAY